MTLDLWACLIALLAFGSAAYLAWRALKRRETIIWSAVVPRAYIMAMYAWFVFAPIEIESRQILVRAGLIVLFVVENLNHVLSERSQAHGT